MRVLTYRQLQKKLRRRDKSFIFDAHRGKGSHRMIEHPNIGGQRKRYVFPVHGEGGDIDPRHLREFAKRFGLPKDFFD